MQETFRAIMAFQAPKNSMNSHAPGSTPAATPSSSAQTDDTAQEQPRHPGSESYPDRTHFRENGRDYAFFRGEKNLLPCDEDEMDRMDMIHHFFTVARKKDESNRGLHRYPLPSDPKVLDLGCGTGIWTIDVSDYNHRWNAPGKYIGWDLAFIQPQRIPYCVKFEQRDIEDPWTGVDEDSFDLIHARMLLGSVANWYAMYEKILRHLKPGTGVLEHVELEFRPLCDDSRFPENSKFLLWYRELIDAYARAGQPMVMDPNTQAMLEHLGYVEITHEEMKIPYNSWPPAGHERDLGKWLNLAVAQGLPAMSYAPFTRILGYSKDQVDALLEEVKKEMCDRHLHSYCILHIWNAKRPATMRHR